MTGCVWVCGECWGSEHGAHNRKHGWTPDDFAKTPKGTYLKGAAVAEKPAELCQRTGCSEPRPPYNTWLCAGCNQEYQAPGVGPSMTAFLKSPKTKPPEKPVDRCE